MVRRMVTAAVVTLCLSMASVAAAANVTFVLNTGERQSGQLVYHKDLNIGLVQNGQERSFAVSDVAAILYNGGDPIDSELSQLPLSDNPAELERHMLVLRDGRVIHGKVYHRPGWRHQPAAARRLSRRQHAGRRPDRPGGYQRSVRHRIAHEPNSDAGRRTPVSRRER